MDRIYLITHPRTASNLLVQVLGLEDQPKVTARPHAGYYFLDTLYYLGSKGLRGKHIDQWTEEEKTQTRAVYQKGYNEMEKYLDEAKAEGRIAVVKEHANLLIEPSHQTKFFFNVDKVNEAPLTLDVSNQVGTDVSRTPLNETVFPDEFLLSWKPVFLIRHPALVFPSYYRCMDDIDHMMKKDADGKRTGSLEDVKPDLKIGMSFHCTRALYDWYSQKLSKAGTSSSVDTNTWPLVIDADDVIGEPEAVLKLADIMGLDREKLKFKWDPISTEEKQKRYNDMEKRMLSTLNESTGIMKDKIASNIDIEAESVKWKKEFGEIDGQKMYNWVKEAMPDYEYLKARKIRA
ncbi:hypothetical protein FQN57_001660 [Myotisia sp. PD_48]|nr:hypothetical protein FQN57_001660 [Myotisia sp. PD_48]